MKCCCFQLFDEYCDKIFSWWLSWIFLCGVLACCIAGFVTANRFGFALYGTQCAYERIYDDIMYGQHKDNFPKWEGFQSLKKTITYLENIIKSIKKKTPLNFPEIYNSYDEIQINSTECSDEYFYECEEVAQNLVFPIPKDFIDPVFKEINKSNKKEKIESIKKINNYIYPFILYFIDIYMESEFIKKQNDEFVKQIEKIYDLQYSIGNLTEYKTNFIKDFTYYVNVAKAMGKILPIIYFSLLLTFVVASGALLITYYCKKVNQQWWILPMHIAWNGLRFFIFSFFMYGCAYGMLYLGAKDAIAFLKYGAFDENNINGDNVIIIPKKSQTFFKYCLFNNPAYEELKENTILNDFIKNELIFNSLIKNKTQPDINDDTITNKYNNILGIYENYFNEYFNDIQNNINQFQDIINKGHNIYDNLNCSFIENNLNLMYRAMWDFAFETKVLCALSCCIGFFGEISVYSFLWVMHLWNKGDNNINIYKSSNNKKKNKNYKISPPKEMDDESNTELVDTKNNNKYGDDDTD